MKIADLRHQVVIQKKILTDDGYGSFVETLSPVLTTWAAIWPVSAKEIRSNMRVEANITHNVRIRYRSGITHAMLVEYGARTFKIEGIINYEERCIFLDLVCFEIL